MAGINAARKVQEKEPVILKRSEAYIGVLIDDLVGKGTDEPYRMFTSRAEHRILLRQDNADLRLTKIGHDIGLASDERFELMQAKSEAVDKVHKIISEHSVQPSVLDSYLEEQGTSALKQAMKLPTIITRPQVSLEGVLSVDTELAGKIADVTTDTQVVEQVEIQLKYAGYIEKEFQMVDEINRQENMVIPDKINYDQIKSLSSEGVVKLKKVRPETIGQASRISGVTPSDIAVLMIYLKK